MGISFSNIGTVGREQLITSGSNGEVKYKIAVTVMEGVSQTILKKVIVVLLKISRMIKSKCTFRFSGCS